MRYHGYDDAAGESSGPVPRHSGPEGRHWLGLNHQKFTAVDARFDRVDKDIGELKSDVKSGFAELRTEMNMRFIALETVIGSLQRTLLGGAAAIVAVLISALIASLVA